MVIGKKKSSFHLRVFSEISESWKFWVPGNVKSGLIVYIRGPKEKLWLRKLHQTNEYKICGCDTVVRTADAGLLKGSEVRFNNAIRCRTSC